MKRLFLLFVSITILYGPAAIADETAGADLSSLNTKTILLAGATGNNGSEILRQLTDLGVKVRAMTRDKAAAAEEHGVPYNWVEADVTKPETLTDVMEGVDIVISAVATMMPLGSNRSEKVDYEGTKNLIAAAKAAGVERFMIITSAHSGDESHWLNYIGGNVLVWKGEAEKALVASGLDYVIVAPSIITDEPGDQKAIRLMHRDDWADGMTVSLADMAKVIIAAACHPDAANRIVTIANVDGAASDEWQNSFADMPGELEWD